MLKEKWTSVIFHIQNKPTWTGNTLYHQCSHGELSKEDSFSKGWISTKSKAFQALQSALFDETLLKGMVHLTKFSYTGVLEVYHSVLNKWASRSTHFSYKGMVAWCEPPAIDFNPIRPRLLGGIKSQGGSTKNHTFENHLLIVKMVWNLVWVIFGIFPFA